MRITITVRHTEVDDDLRAHTRELVGKVVKLVRRPHHAQVIFTQDHGEAGGEIEIHAPRGRGPVAQSQAADLLSAPAAAGARGEGEGVGGEGETGCGAAGARGPTP